MDAAMLSRGVFSAFGAEEKLDSLSETCAPPLVRHVFHPKDRKNPVALTVLLANSIAVKMSLRYRCRQKSASSS